MLIKVVFAIYVYVIVFLHNVVLAQIVVLRRHIADAIDLSIGFNKIPDRKKGNMHVLPTYIIPIVTGSSILNSNQV